MQGAATAVCQRSVTSSRCREFEPRAAVPPSATVTVHPWASTISSRYERPNPVPSAESCTPFEDVVPLLWRDSRSSRPRRRTRPQAHRRSRSGRSRRLRRRPASPRLGTVFDGVLNRFSRSWSSRSRSATTVCSTDHKCRAVRRNVLPAPSTTAPRSSDAVSVTSSPLRASVSRSSISCRSVRCAAATRRGARCRVPSERVESSLSDVERISEVVSRQRLRTR